MDLLALLPKELRRGTHSICRVPPRIGFVACAFIRHSRAPRAAAAPVADDHGQYGLNLAIAGTATYRDRQGARHPLASGTIFQFSDPADGARGGLEPDSGFLECMVSFHATMGAKLDELGIWKPAFLSAATEPSAALLQRYLDLYQRMVASPISYDEALRGIVGIVDLAYSHAAGASVQQRLMAEACRLLADRDDPDTARRVAKDLDLPYETFRKLFQRQVGMAPHAYRLQQRMKMASDWLGAASVKEVAARLGYRTPFAFSRQFKKVMGVSPKTFKR